ncbi:MAG: Ig-like domain-containing protein, partial [Bacteroidales bacterium]
NKKLNWASSNTSVATVNSTTGEVIAVGGGVTIITATTTDGSNKSDTSELTVFVAVDSVSVIPKNHQMRVEDTYQLQEVVHPSDATNKEVTWKPLDEEIATVDSNGLVTGVSVGSARIEVSTVEGNKKDISVFNILPITLESVKIPQAFTMNIRERKTLPVTYVPHNATNKTVTWESLNTSIATVDRVTGEITAKAFGQTRIKVTSADGGHVDECILFVEERSIPVKGMKIHKEQTTVLVGGNERLGVIFNPYNATNQSVNWSSSDTSTVDVQDGLVIGLKVGKATITARSVEGNFVSTCDVFVVDTVVSVKDVSLNESFKRLDPLSALELKAKIEPNGATNQKVTWHSSDTNVATVHWITGLVVALQDGTTIITVTTDDGAKKDSCEIEVSTLAQSVVITPKNHRMAINTNYTDWIVDVKPEQTTNKKLNWTSSNTSVATINRTTGEVTAVGGGVTIITATTTDGTEKTDTSELTVFIPVESVEVTPKNPAIRVEDKYQLQVHIYPSDATNQSVTWTPLDKEIATVDATGMVTGVGVGSARIQAESVDGNKTDISVFTVLPILLEAIKIPQTLNLGINGKNTLPVTYVPHNATDKTVTWESSDTSVATVDRNSGQITGKALGKTTITATSVDGGFSDTCTVQVGVHVTSVDIPSTSNMDIGEKKNLSVNIKPTNATNQALTWTSSNTSVATVDKNTGQITGKALGQTTITATSVDGGLSDTCALQVGVHVTSIDLPSTFTVNPGEKKKLTVIYKPSNATNQSATWTSSNTSAATVDKNTGEITGIKLGQTTITATSVDGGFSDTCAVQVGIALLGIDIPSSTTIAIGEKKTLAVTYSPSNASNKEVTWTSSNTSVATVDRNSGQITGIKLGQTTITATSVEGGRTDTCSLQVGTKVTGVGIIPTSITLGIGQTKQLIATVEPPNASDKTVTWATSDTSIASVGTNTGLVTITGDGNATITATTREGGFTATATVRGLNFDIITPEFIATSCNHTAYLSEKGDMYTWGDNGDGQLGLNDRKDRGYPTKVTKLPPGVKSWVTVASGLQKTVALGDDGNMYFSGRSLYNTFTKVGLPSGSKTWKKVTASLEYFGGIDDRGIAYINGTSPKESFARIDPPQGQTWEYFKITHTSGNWSTFVIHYLITNTGDLYYVNGKSSNKQRLHSGYKWKAATADWSAAFGIMEDNKLYTWNYSSSSPSPISVSGTNGFIDVSASWYAQQALSLEGELYTWGTDRYSKGKLGHGTSVTQLSSPKKIVFADNMSYHYISVGHEHMVALSTRNKISAWGYQKGGLGNGMSQSWVPVDVPRPTSRFSGMVFSIKDFFTPKQNTQHLHEELLLEDGESQR